MKHVVVSNAFTDDNKGGSAITMATLQTIRAAFSDCSLSLMTINQSAGSHRHTEKIWPEAELLPSPFSGADHTFGNNLAALARSIWALVRQPARPPEPVKRILEADLVVSKGGQVYVERRSLRGVLGLWFTAFPIVLASRYGVPTVVYSATIGPFKKRPSRMLTGWILRRASLVMPRDAHSLREALELGVKPSKIRQMQDTVLLLDRPPKELSTEMSRRLGFEPGRFAVLTVKGAWRADHSEFLEELHTAVKRILDEGIVESVALVVQVHGDAASDLAPSRDFAERCGDPRIRLVTEDLSPKELMALYGAARLTIGCRVHSAIFSLIAGTPAFVVGMAGPKAEDLFTSLGLQRFVIRYPRFEAGQLVADVRRAVEDYQLGKEIDRIVSEASRSLGLTPGVFRELVGEPSVGIEALAKDDIDDESAITT